ncbi:hypothetical protein DNK59_05675 [Pseudomonas sp. TKO26]|nr:hypothetical protein DNK62_05675 [Pseudomonas sp. TKO30]PYY92670.1 hypothetical protein DNK61_05675 [Pseudomonas sp. TKO29]PYY95034.1 hypothetical protein DNK59_05675 [Pseudomonas sp. TKO26]PYZ01120.1 hypothetical protein DNK60_05675 [Pseudomonas sp. TKO14]
MKRSTCAVSVFATANRKAKSWCRSACGRPNRTSHRRSWLAGEQALKPCLALRDAFAGKPAPTAGGLIG